MSNVVYPSQFVCPVDGTTPEQRLQTAEGIKLFDDAIEEVSLQDTLQSMDDLLFSKVAREVRDAMTGEYGIDDWDALTKRQAVAIERCLIAAPDDGIVARAIEHIMQVYAVEDQLVNA